MHHWYDLFFRALSTWLCSHSRLSIVLVDRDAKHSSATCSYCWNRVIFLNSFPLSWFRSLFSVQEHDHHTAKSYTIADWQPFLFVSNPELHPPSSAVLIPSPQTLSSIGTCRFSPCTLRFSHMTAPQHQLGIKRIYSDENRLIMHMIHSDWMLVSALEAHVSPTLNPLPW